MQHVYFTEYKLYCPGQYISQIRLLAICPQRKLESLTPFKLHSEEKLKFWTDM